MHLLRKDFGRRVWANLKCAAPAASVVTLLLILFPLEAFANDALDTSISSFLPKESMLILGFIALSFPAAIMVLWERLLFKGQPERKPLWKAYLRGVLVLNIWTIVIACFYSVTWRSFVSSVYSEHDEAGGLYPIWMFLQQHIALIGALAYIAVEVVLTFLIPCARKTIWPKVKGRIGPYGVGHVGGIRKAQEVFRRIGAHINQLGGGKRFLRDTVITIGLAAVLFVAGSFKSGFHVDEMLTFGLSNHVAALAIDDGAVYDGEALWHDYLDIPDGGKFDYVSVFLQQARDCHPPFYYILIHTLSSLFSSLSIVWIGLLVHVPLACIAFWQLVWIGKKLGVRRGSAILIAATYTLGMGFFDTAVVFFRMYGLLTIWAQFLIMVFLSSPATHKGTLRYYLSLGVVLLGGLMTQYYFLIFACFTCLAYAVWLVSCKNWGKLRGSIYTALCSAALWLSIFPYVIFHILRGGRGTQSFDNLIHSSLKETFGAYLQLINSYVFGSLLIVLIAAILCLIAVVFLLSGKSALKRIWQRSYPYSIMVIPFAFFVLVVAKVAPYHNTLRYIVAGCGIFYVAVFAVLMHLAGKIHNRAKIAVCVCTLLVMVGGYIHNGFPQLYLQERENIESLNEYKGSPCLYYYPSEKRWMVLPNLSGLRAMDKIVFVNVEDWERDEPIGYTGGPLVVYIAKASYLEVTHEDILSHLEHHYGLTQSEQLFTRGYSTAYVIK